MRKSRAYRSRNVKDISLGRLLQGREGQRLSVGFDVSKEDVRTVLRWGDQDFERPWKVKNPDQLGVLVERLVALSRNRELLMALEPTGTYGDPLRQALSDAGLVAHRVSPKASHDYAEIFDGVPSQHDGKDAAVVAELSALGKSKVWQFHPTSEVDAEMAYQVDWLDIQRRSLNTWYGRLEALLARHWPEATQLMPLTSGTLLRCLSHYGGPAALASDQEALGKLLRWSGRHLSSEKAESLLSAGRRSMGVRQGKIDEHRMRKYAEQAIACRRETSRSRRSLEELAKGNEVIQQQAGGVGVVTACVLWVHLGNPREYDCGPAYRKAMGLNLAERSSGKWQGRLMISKRGHSQVRRWLYFAALRLVQEPAVRIWYEQKKAKGKNNEEVMRALIGVMRRLALALYHVAAHDERFEIERLFPGAAKRHK